MSLWTKVLLSVTVRVVEAVLNTVGESVQEIVTVCGSLEHALPSGMVHKLGVKGTIGHHCLDLLMESSIKR